MTVGAYILEWPVWETYNVSWPCYRPGGICRRIYEPAKEPALVCALAGLHAYIDNEQDFQGKLVQFVCAFGMLSKQPHEHIDWARKHVAIVHEAMSIKKKLQDNQMLGPNAYAHTKKLNLRLDELVNSGSCKVERIIVDGQRVFKFEDLLQLVYWCLADQIEQNPIKTCDGCGAMFFAHDKRQKYCPRWPRRRESPCGSKQAPR